MDRCAHDHAHNYSLYAQTGTPMYMYTHIHTHTCTHACTSTHVRMHKHARTRTHTHACTHAHIHAHTHTHTHTYEHMHTDAHTCSHPVNHDGCFRAMTSNQNHSDTAVSDKTFFSCNGFFSPSIQILHWIQAVNGGK